MYLKKSNFFSWEDFAEKKIDPDAGTQNFLGFGLGFGYKTQNQTQNLKPKIFGSKTQTQTQKPKNFGFDSLIIILKSYFLRNI